MRNRSEKKTEPAGFAELNCQLQKEEKTKTMFSEHDQNIHIMNPLAVDIQPARYWPLLHGNYLLCGRTPGPRRNRTLVYLTAHKTRNGLHKNIFLTRNGVSILPQV